MYQQTPSIWQGHDVMTARKNAKFTMKLSAACHAVLGRCGESRRSNRLTATVRFFEYTMYSVCKYIYSPCTCICTTYMYTNSANYL